MSARAAARRLERLGPLTTHFKRRSGKVTHYREFLFYWDGEVCVAGYSDAKVTRPFRVNGETIFDRSFRAFRVQRVGSTYTTIRVFSDDERYLGTYSDTTLPWAGVRKTSPGAFETEIDDLYLDHYILPDGRGFVLDLGELHEGLAAALISAGEALLALETVTEIDARARAGRYPTLELAGLDLDPALLRGLPADQE